MNERKMLTDHLGRLTGMPVRLVSVSGPRLKGLSALLARTHHFAEWIWLGKVMVLAIPQEEQEEGQEDVSRLKARLRTMEEHFGLPVVLVLPRLSAFRRDRLVQSGIPFIVPKTQLFIPPFADLCERYAREVRVEKLSAAAQATVLHQLLHQPTGPMPLKAWAAELRYSPMTLTKVRDELVAVGLCAPQASPRAHGLQFLHEGQALWEKGHACMRSPIFRQRWIRLHRLPPEGMARAGMTALANLTMIAEDPIPTYACRSSSMETLLQSSFFECREHREEADSILECWRYDPCLFAKDGIVDRLSLHLCLAGSDDERIRLACDDLLEGMSW